MIMPWCDLLGCVFREWSGRRNESFVKCIEQGLRKPTTALCVTEPSTSLKFHIVIFWNATTIFRKTNVAVA